MIGDRPCRVERGLFRRFCASFWERLWAALVANPFWRWNTFWIAMACLGTNAVLAVPKTYLDAHPGTAWTLQQLVFVFALIYKFWTNKIPDLPLPKATKK